MPNPVSPVVEIIEYARNIDRDDTDPLTVIIPNDVLINGVSILCSDDPIVIHEMSTGNDSGIVKVTLTVIARRVIFERRQRPEGDPAPPWPPRDPYLT